MRWPEGLVRWASALLLGLAALSASPTARAELVKYSAYERRIIARELARRGYVEDDAPEGKFISSIECARLEVLDETDPFPDLFNVFHFTTRDGVIRRELLVDVGERYSSIRLDQTARNLRALQQLSLVLVVPARDPVSNRVRLLVITKDVWSLRPNWNVQLSSEGLSYLYLNPSEWNLFGTHAILGVTFELARSTWAGGLSVAHQRIFGSRLSGEAAGGLYFNRSTQRNEGAFGTFRYELPQYTAEQRVRFRVEASFLDKLQRVSKKDVQGRSFLLPYRREYYAETASVTRSFGRRHKLELSGGIDLERRNNQPRVPANVEPALARSFIENDIPLSDTRLSPFVQLSTYENAFLRTIEFETLGLQEDIRLGPRALLKLLAASRRVGSSRDLLGIVSGVSYTHALSDGLVRGVAQASVQYADHGRHQVLGSAALRFVTPRLGFGRFLTDVLVEARPYNYLRVRSEVGGDGRLRGYPAADAEVSGSVRGAQLLAWNTEFRSAGVDVLSAQCGLTLFSDVAGAADHFTDLHVKRSVGLGVRVLFPQFDRLVFRVDYAFPVGLAGPTFPGQYFASLGQAFPLPELGK